MDRNEKKTRKLREKADKARQAGQSKKALDLYLELCAKDPEEPRWPHQAGEMHKKLGQLNASVEHFVTAARLYHEQGFDVKAVAMCKVLLAIDPLNGVGLELLEKVTGAPKAPRVPPPGATPVPGHPPTTAELVAAATGGRDMMTPASQDLAPMPRGRRAARETSPKELQSLNLSDLESILEPGAPGESSSAATRQGIPAVTPPGASSPGTRQGLPPVKPPLPQTPSRPTASAPAVAPGSPPPVEPTPKPTRQTLDVAIEIEGYEDVLGGDAAPKDPAHTTLTLSEEELEELEVQEDGPVVVDEPIHTPAKPARQTQDLTPEELEILDDSDLAFMEVLESSEIQETQKPTKRPTLKRNAPLETLDLRDVMPGRERRSSQPHLGEMYEVPFEDSRTGQLPEYEKRLTPSKAMPDMTPPGLFRSLGIDATKSLVTRMNFVAKAPGDVIIQQGDVGGSLYVIVRGEVRIVKELDGQRTEVTRLSDGEFFGEMALVTDTPRVATVEAITEVELLEVTRETMRLLIQDFPQVVPNLIKFLKDRLLEIFVKTSTLLSPVPEKYRWQLARKFKLYEIHEGKTILREGKPSGGLFIFLAGQAVATRSRRNKILKLAELGPGAVIGEISLVTGGPAVASVTAKTKCWLLAVSAKQFEVLTKNFPDLRVMIEKLADQRRRENARILAGDPNYVSQELRLV